MIQYSPFVPRVPLCFRRLASLLLLKLPVCAHLCLHSNLLMPVARAGQLTPQPYWDDFQNASGAIERFIGVLPPLIPSAIASDEKLARVALHTLAHAACIRLNAVFSYEPQYRERCLRSAIAATTLVSQTTETEFGLLDPFVGVCLGYSFPVIARITFAAVLLGPRRRLSTQRPLRTFFRRSRRSSTPSAISRHAC